MLGIGLILHPMFATTLRVSILERRRRGESALQVKANRVGYAVVSCMQADIDAIPGTPRGDHDRER